MNLDAIWHADVWSPRVHCVGRSQSYQAVKIMRNCNGILIDFKNVNRLF